MTGVVIDIRGRRTDGRPLERRPVDGFARNRWSAWLEYASRSHLPELHPGQRPSRSSDVSTRLSGPDGSPQARQPLDSSLQPAVPPRHVFVVLVAR